MKLERYKKAGYNLLRLVYNFEFRIYLQPVFPS
jgi:hypothetical protein